MQLEHTYATELSDLVAPWSIAEFPDLELFCFNEELGARLGIDAAALRELLRTPGHAMGYSGHQFGQFSPLLGDGRALLLGELPDSRLDLHIKGSGPTPFSRGGDGQAALGPMLREYVVSEAMAALGVPTTRSLAVFTTGRKIMRTGAVPGALLVRVASSHIRVGTFQFGAIQAQGTPTELLDYAIARHLPGATPLEFFRHVIDRNTRLVARWMRLGFVHGVMNTDNVAISGETIDYGPFAFMERFDANTVFSSIDAHGRYAFGNQPTIMGWNLARFAETLIGPVSLQDAEEALRAYPAAYREAWLQEMAFGLGLGPDPMSDPRPVPEGFPLVADALVDLLGERSFDLTCFMRFLAEDPTSSENPYAAMFPQPEVSSWVRSWLALGPDFSAMRKVCPVYVPRNRLVDEAVDNPELLPALLERVRSPFQLLSDPLTDPYALPSPEDAPPTITYCGT